MKCLKCGAEMPNNARFCTNCGAEIKPQTQSGGNQGSYTQNQQSPDTNYIFCGECGAKNPDYLQICSSCGKRLNTYAEPARHTAGTTRKVRETSKKGSSRKYIAAAAVLAALILTAAAIAVVYNMNNDAEVTVDVDVSQETIQPDASSEPTENPSSDSADSEDALIGTNSVRYETYYIVNCSSTPLRESPDTASAILYDIPLGSPVSYIDSYQDGFAKVIYNGTTGYVLQTYLSSNSADIQKLNTTDNSSNSSSGSSSNSSSNSGGGSGNSSNTTASVGVVSNPTYKTYVDSTYNFSCSYPSHFTVYNDSDSFVRYSLKAPDNTATLKICAKTNSSGTTAAAAKSSFQSTYPGSIDYQNSGDDWFACRTYKSGTYHYAYYKFKDGMIRGFELHFDGNYFDIYDGYVNDIYKSLNFN